MASWNTSFARLPRNCCLAQNRGSCASDSAVPQQAYLLLPFSLGMVAGGETMTEAFSISRYE